MSKTNFDYIIIGSGSSGATLASRICENGKYTVLLLEAGDKPRGIWFKIPLGIGKVLHNNKYVWKFFSDEITGINNRKVYMPQGKILGGSSSVNGMVYSRGIPARFDEWADLGCPGWSFKEVLPYFKKMENYPEGNPEFRGTNGPLRISEVSQRDNLSEAFKLACINSGIPEIKDYNEFHGEGVGYLQLNTKRGLRESTLTSYLKKFKKNKNLEIRTKSIAEKIIIQDKKAIGVIVNNGKHSYEVFANKEVIISAGAIQSPKLLELSGIGNPLILEKLNIKVIHKLPGVGENLQDHINVRSAYKSHNTSTINDALSNPWEGFKLGLRYIFCRNGLLSTPSATIQAMLKSDNNQSYPDIKIQLVHLSEKGRFGVAHDSGVDNFSGFSIGAYQLFPKSKGSVHIQSNNFFDSPLIKPNYLNHPDDLSTMLKAVKFARHVANQSPLKSLILEELRPGNSVINDNDLIFYMREVGQTTYHPVGTCKMGMDELSVVDSKLRVHGIDFLRVVDASVMPILVSSNTNAAAIMIGEKAADLILNQ